MSQNHNNEQGDDIAPDTLPRIISKKELLRSIPYCDQHILRLEKQGKFPRRIDLGDNRVGWHLHEVLAWIKSRPARIHPADSHKL